MQQENALIGVQVAAYYPDISLSALGGYAGNPLAQLFNVSNRVLVARCIGTETLFNGGCAPPRWRRRGRPMTRRWRPIGRPC